MWTNTPYWFHIGSWLVWLLAAMVSALLTRNPFYLVLVIAVAAIVNRGLARAAEAARSRAALSDQPSEGDSLARGRGLLLRAVLVLTVLVAFLKGISVHLGATVLFTLPEEWPVIGGPVTLEGLASSGLDGLSLLAVLSVFITFSAGADYYALLRAVPAFMHQVGLITSIAITFVPQTVTRFAEIREAQALRGHRLRRVGDLLPLLMPLLAGGMERSLNLAEAMESRGFSRPASSSKRLPPIAVQAGLALGLGMVLVGSALPAFYPEAPLLALLLVLAGLALLTLTLWAVGRGTMRSRYRRGTWRERDTVLAVASAAVLAIVLTYRVLTPSALTYDPISRLRLYPPPFDPVLALALLALCVPVLIVSQASAGGRIAT